ncbi:zinc-ribbon domain-containing protein [Proteiniclasticum sp.]|uniref:YfgJ family double zinc ribbon protein n=1 Tax=Proteiniclasticum sp. TaxID=2053595 RepID=UPI0028978D8B|nr:zinc-ribbon domain-containing protein [Proteiniclasticum sp.]
MRLFNSVKSVIMEMVVYGGRDTEKDLFGNTCPYNTRMSKNMAEMSCPQCGMPIEKANYIGSSIYFCRECQTISGGR